MLWLKAFHIMAVVTWFAGLFYLPRLYVYHADATDTISIERFRIMERRLFGIMTIGALAAVVLGAAMMRDFAANRNTRSGKWYRVFNEVPSLLLIAIVLLAVVKPF